MSSAPPPRIAVVVEDDADIRNLLEAILGQAGFTCYTAESGPEGIEAIRTHQPILTTLDISLPGIDGFEVARQIRSFSTTYIIMLSARDEEIDTLMGLDAGADDYLTKPFRPRELRARIEAMLRRYHLSTPVVPADSGPGSAAPVADRSAGTETPAGSHTEDDGWLSHNGLRINADMWLCDLDGAPVELTRSEFDLLLAIMTGARRVVSKDSLALELRGEYATGSGYVSDSDRRAVEVHMANLRRKLNDPVSSPRYIETVRGVGYRLAEAQPG
jgi:DNA-binding response OmpR family regulator